VWSLTWQDDSGAAIDLTGATVTGKISPTGGPSVALAGAITVINAVIGRFDYRVAANEVGTAGNYVIQCIATYPTSDPLMSDPITVTFVAAT